MVRVLIKGTPESCLTCPQERTELKVSCLEENLTRAGPHWLLISNFQPPELGEINSHCWQATQSVTLWYTSLDWQRQEGQVRVTCIWIISTSTTFQFSRSVVSDPLRHHGLQHASLPCPSPTPRVYSKLCPSSWWCHPAISSSVDPFSSLLQSFPGSGSFSSSQFFLPDVLSIILTLIPSIWVCSCRDSHELFTLLWPNNTPKPADF